MAPKRRSAAEAEQEAKKDGEVEEAEEEEDDDEEDPEDEFDEDDSDDEEEGEEGEEEQEGEQDAEQEGPAEAEEAQEEAPAEAPAPAAADSSKRKRGGKRAASTEGEGAPAAKVAAVEAEPAEEAIAEAPDADAPPEEQLVEAPTQAMAEAPVVAAAEQAVAEAPEEPKGPKSRLMIREIVLTNFKSYGNRKVIGPFHKSFSSIVGPNGSGKSNTIDALLFVFGKRAKKMRLNKVSELIHQSAELPNVPSAKVEVTFQDIIDTGDGPEDYEVVPGSLLCVAREAFRNNQSKYYMDGKASNFTEVTQKLRKRGVDLEHNRFLILQGEVEQISLMKPKALTPHEDGLLEYLEDIIGSNRHVEPIEQAEGVVEQLTETRTEKLNRLRVAEREKDSLDGPRKEAEAWVGAEAERLEFGALLAQSEAARSHAGLAGLEEEHKVLTAQMEEHKQKMQVFEKQVKAIEADHDARLNEYNTVKGQMEKAALDFKEFEKQDVKFTEDIAFQEQRLQKIQQAADQEAANAKQLLEDAERLRSEAPTREKELESAERFKASQAQKLEKIYESLKGKAEELRPAKEAKEAELVPIQKKLTEVRKVVEVAQTEAELIREKTAGVTKQIEEMKQQHAECSETLKARESEAQEASRSRKDRVKLVEEAKQRLGAVDSQMDQVGRDVMLTRQKAEEAKSQFEEEHHRGKLIRAVYEQSKAGRLRGVHGRLGDLGTIPKKYDVAVSTACSMLDAIVVDSTEDAQAVIEFIRQNDLGRTTCICLQKIKNKEAEMQQQVQTPEGAPRLVDLIKPTKEEYKVAFFFALTHTIVAKDMDQATRCAFQGKRRWRVVTLEGGLIDTSGTMSGGGNKVARGGMKSSLCQYSPEEVKALVQAHEQASGRLQAMRQEKRALEEALQQTEKEIADWELKEKKCSMEAGSLKKQVEAYDKRLAELKVPSLSSSEKSKLKELEKLINGRSNELNRIQAQHQAVEEEVRALHDQIMNIGGEELKTAKAKLEEATKKCEDLRKNMKKALLDADNMVKNSKAAEEAVKSSAKERVKAEKELASLREEHAKLDDKAEQVLNAYNKLKEELVKQDQVLTKLREKRAEVIEETSAMKRQDHDIVIQMEEKTNALKGLYGKIKAWGERLVQVRQEYEQLPLDLLGELREAQDAPADVELARRAIKEDLGEPDLKKVNRGDVEARMLTLEANVKDLKPNLASIEEFRRADKEYKTRLADYEDVNNRREDARRQLESLRQQRLEEFMDGFSVISMKLKEMYQMITLGGDAELELVDTLDPFSEGINFSVRPPKKSWKQITNLSGGEKTLASLSLVFALHHYKPTPLYFMDEIDAALDFRNVSIIANYIKERTKNAQFIVISLRNHMFEMADLLVGIYKTQDISKSVAINPYAFEVKKPPQMVPGMKALQEAPPASQPPTKRRALAPLAAPEAASQDID